MDKISVLRNIFLILLLIFPSVFVFSSGFNENELDGNKLYKEGDFEGALAEYSGGLATKADYDLYYNRGVSYYKLDQYEKSFSDFENAATYANSEKDQIKAVYNAGNSNFMAAETVKTENPGQALEFYDKAVKHFERVLELDSDNQNASYNLELSRLRLDEIEQHQNDEQEDGDQQSDDQQDGDQQDSNEQSGEQQESQQQDNNEPGEEQQEQSQHEEQNGSENPEESYLSDEISPKDILNEEARRQEVRQLLITNGSGEVVDKDW